MNKLRCAKAQADLLLPNNLFQLNNLNIPFTNLNYFLLFKVYYVYWSRPKQMWLVLSWKSLRSWFRFETCAFSAVWHSQCESWVRLKCQLYQKPEQFVEFQFWNDHQFWKMIIVVYYKFLQILIVCFGVSSMFRQNYLFRFWGKNVPTYYKVTTELCEFNCWQLAKIGHDFWK